MHRLVSTLTILSLLASIGSFIIATLPYLPKGRDSPSHATRNISPRDQDNATAPETTQSIEDRAINQRPQAEVKNITPKCLNCKAINLIVRFIFVCIFLLGLTRFIRLLLAFLMNRKDSDS
jgi:hypothetical protein